MSARKLPSRTNSRRGKSRRSRTSGSLQIPFPLLEYLIENKAKTRKKPTPRKRLSRATRTASAVPTHSVATTSTEMVNIEDSSPETLAMLHDVDSKIGNFMQSGSFISSDEDETEMIKAKTNKKLSPNPFFISDDSDDDCKVVKELRNTSELDFSTPSTSAGTSKNPAKEDNLESIDDIMNIVDSVLDNKLVEQSPLKDMKSLEDYRKETEEMLKNASSLIDEIKKGCKPESEEKKNEPTSPQVTVGACPVCLESLASRPAAVTVCGHIFCKPCITETAQILKKCPTCRKPINSKKIHPIYF